MKEMDPIAVLRQVVKQHGSQTKAADALGVSGAYLSDLLNGNRPVSARILQQLGLERKVVKA